MPQEFRGFRSEYEEVVVGEQRFRVLVPTDYEKLLNDPEVQRRFERDEYMPYWANLWPAAVLLAREVAKWEPTGVGDEAEHVLELGAGVGLVGLVLAGRGFRVTISDYDADALAFAYQNARENRVGDVAVRRIDWRERYADLKVERIVAADVLYESRNLPPVADFIAHHLVAGGKALLSDPGRSTADEFAQVARAQGLGVTVFEVMRDLGGAWGQVRGRFFEVRRKRV